MQITYIGHSGFFVRTREMCYLFDYEKGRLPQPEPGECIVMLASHAHPDHYNPDAPAALRTSSIASSGRLYSSEWRGSVYSSSTVLTKQPVSSVIAAPSAASSISFRRTA